MYYKNGDNMFFTDKMTLEKYGTDYRLWQGIPSIAVTPKGRVFICFYSGGLKEEIGNFVVLIKSDDGNSYSEPIAVCEKEGCRCFDPCLWIDPLQRLWLIWTCLPGEDEGAYAVICDNPDADELRWSEPFLIGYNVMMNKPTVLTTGEWLFPIAVWTEQFRRLFPKTFSVERETGAFVYKTVDNGKTFQKMGGVNLLNRSFDEHMILEKTNGNLVMYVRTVYGIGISYSFDRGLTWSKGEDSGIEGPSSRFHIKRLKSGRVLLINHYNFVGRNNLYALLSEDEGKTWKYKLLLDERNNVSYPDAFVTDDGVIHITYDRERGGFLNSLDDVYNEAREILYARITEADIIAGNLVDSNSRLKVVVSKLGKYVYEEDNPFKEIDKLSDLELAEELVKYDNDVVLSKLFEYFTLNCFNMSEYQSGKFDLAVKSLELEENRLKKLMKIIRILRETINDSTNVFPIVERVKELILEDITQELTLDQIVQKLGISKYYLVHTFKTISGTTIVEYRNSLRLTKAKKLLIETNKNITEIAVECGFGNASYFSKLFKQSEKISPSEYREYHKL